MKLWVVVPAAGSGQRFGSVLPKQYQPVAGHPLLAHTLHALLSHPQIQAVMLVLAENDAYWPGWQRMAGKTIHTCSGGSSRAASVLAGLSALPAEVKAADFVLVHDAARPNVSANDISRLIDQGIKEKAGAILAAPLHDTLKRRASDGRIEHTEPRAALWRALTPQLFRRHALQHALKAGLKSGIDITDEAMAMERCGARPLLVEGAPSNFKITTTEDLARFEFELSHRENPIN